MPKKLFTDKTMTPLEIKDFNIVSAEETYIISNKGKYGILLVYKETCPFCVALKKVASDLAKEFTHLSLPFYVADQTEYKYLYMVKTVPAFYLITPNGRLHQLQPEKRTVYDLLVAYISVLTKINENESIKKRISNSLYNDIDEVVQLSFGDFIKTDSGIKMKHHGMPGILKAYANWCIFCKMKTEMVTKLAKDVPNISIYVADLAEDKENPLNSIVAGYPTFLFIDTDGYVHSMSDKAVMEKLLLEEEKKGISPEQKKDIIFAINTVMN